MALRYSPSYGPDPLTDNWTYDSAIDLFSCNAFLPDPFALDLPDYLDLPDPVAGFAVPGDASESASDPESDDQPWSPPTHAPTTTDTLSSNPPTGQSSPEIHPSDPTTRRPRRSRRLASPEAAPTRNAAKRAAHNVIEKRYRTNMNAKFVALEKAMAAGPVSVSVSVSAAAAASASASMPAPGAGPAAGNAKPKSGSSASLKKSEILSNAIAYMHQLQEENRYLQREIAVFKQGYVGSAGGGGAGIWRTPGIKRECR